jgi:hypothetical protein
LQIAGSTHDLREVHRSDTFLIDIVEVDVPEERMLFDVLSIGLACSESAYRVSIQKL